MGGTVRLGTPLRHHPPGWFPAVTTPHTFRRRLQGLAGHRPGDRGMTGRGEVRVPLLTEMTPRAQAIALAYYEAGARDGWARGYAAAEADLAAIHRAAHGIVQQAARAPDYAELCERRGEPGRAQRQREILKKRGLAA